MIEKNSAGTTLASAIKKIIWLCMLPLFFFSVGLAGYQIDVIKRQQIKQASGLADNFILQTDNALRERISALTMLAISPLIDDLSRWNELYQQAEGFYASFKTHVVITDGGPPTHLLLDTRVPFGTALPVVEKPNGRLAGPIAMRTGKTAVSDLFWGPVAKKLLLGLAVPVMRDGKAKYAIVTTIDQDFFQNDIENFTLPSGWALVLKDAEGDTIASLPKNFPQPPAVTYTARSRISDWTVTIGISQHSYWAPLLHAGIALGLALLGVTVVGLLGCQWTGRRLGRSVAALAEPPAEGVPSPEIIEIASVRRLLVDEVHMRAAAEKTLSQREKALQESETRFRTLAEFAPVGIAITDQDGKVIFLNHHFIELFGYTIEELPTIHQWWQLAYPDEKLRESVRKSWTRTLDQAAQSLLPTEPTEYPVTCRDGSIRHIEFRKRVSGNLIFVIMTDLSRRREAEEALAKSHERYHAFITQSHEAIYCTEFDHPIDITLPIEDQIDAIYANGYMGECNQAMASMYGIEQPEFFIGKRLADAHGGNDNPINRDVFRQLIKNGYRKDNSVTEEIHTDGTLRYFQTNDVGIVHHDRLLRIWGTQLDVTETVLANRFLKESRELLNAILNAIPVRVFWKDRNLNYLGCNTAFANDAGFTLVEDVIGKNDFDFSWREFAEQYRADDLSVIETGKVKLMYEEMQTTSTQKPAYLLTSKIPLKGSNGEIIGVLGSYLDITEHKTAEEDNKRLQTQLQQAQKMEAIGTLAGGIAHDFNNILAAIMGYAEMAKDACPDGSDIAKDIDKVLTSGNRAVALVKQILAFSRQADVDRIALQPVHLVKEIIKLLRPALPATIEIKQTMAAAAHSILADPTQIHQVIMNLCTNAFHAMEDTGGILEITLNDCVLSSQDLQHQPTVKAGNFVKISISDTGPGIPKEIQSRIFEPYFTTKEMGKGTGLGLSIVHGIVTSLGGYITCESERGQGTVFHVFLPAIEAKALPLPKQGDLEAAGKEHILLVDDEELLIEMGKAMLERLGYRVTIRSNCLDALATFQNRPQAFDAVVTDQTMPGMTGVDLARRMLQIRPDIPIILCTGYSSIINEDQAYRYGIKGFVMKPYSKKILASTLRKILDKSLPTQ